MGLPKFFVAPGSVRGSFLTLEGENAAHARVLRQAMERMEHSGYAALPVIDKSGKYCGVVTEGDLLWTIKRLCVMDLRQTEEHSISEIEHRRTVQPVRVDTRVEDLISVAADQNFVPVVDDKGDFIGIVTRSRILKYCLQTGFLHE